MKAYKISEQITVNEFVSALNECKNLRNKCCHNKFILNYINDGDQNENKNIAKFFDKAINRKNELKKITVKLHVMIQIMNLLYPHNRKSLIKRLKDVFDYKIANNSNSPYFIKKVTNIVP
jgi:hypothetical protein